MDIDFESDNFYDDLADKVAEKITSKSTFTNLWRPASISSPTVLSIKTPSTLPPLPFENKIEKNLENDKFDVSQLVLQAPPGTKKKVRALLNEIEKHPNELTFDSFGRLIIDTIAIPSSNIFVLLPMLYKQKKSQNLPGLNELIQKLEEMGLKDLFNFKSVSHETGKSKNVLNSKAMGKEKDIFEPNTKNQPWYYIGP